MSLLIGKTVEYYNMVTQQYRKGLLLDKCIGAYHEYYNHTFKEKVKAENDIPVHFFIIQDEENKVLIHVLPKHILKIIDTPTNTTP